MDCMEPMFEKILEYLKNTGVRYFELTGGGEPFLNRNLQDIVDKIRMAVPDAFIKLYTNGSIHKDIFGIDELDISTVHWEKEEINRIYKTLEQRNLMSDLEFFYHPDRYKIRLSVPIFKGCIDNREKACKLISMTRNYVDRYVFRPLLEKTVDYDKWFVDFEISGNDIEVDRECSCFSKVLLWWTDNRLYRDWALKELFASSFYW